MIIFDFVFEVLMQSAPVPEQNKDTAQLKHLENGKYLQV